MDREEILEKKLRELERDDRQQESLVLGLGSLPMVGLAWRLTKAMEGFESAKEVGGGPAPPELDIKKLIDTAIAAAIADVQNFINAQVAAFAQQLATAIADVQNFINAQVAAFAQQLAAVPGLISTAVSTVEADIAGAASQTVKRLEDEFNGPIAVLSNAIAALQGKPSLTFVTINPTIFDGPYATFNDAFLQAGTYSLKGVKVSIFYYDKDPTPRWPGAGLVWGGPGNYVVGPVK